MENNNLNVNSQTNSVVTIQPKKTQSTAFSVFMIVIVQILMTILPALSNTISGLVVNSYVEQFSVTMTSAVSFLVNALVLIVGLVICILFAMTQKSDVNKIIFVTSCLVGKTLCNAITNFLSGVIWLAFANEKIDTMQVGLMDAIVLILGFIFSAIISAVAFIMLINLFKEKRENENAINDENLENAAQEVVFINPNPKSKTVAALLCFFFGLLGIHRFYCGKIGTGILWFLTAGLFGIGSFIDFLLILFGAFKDGNGFELN